MKIIFAELPTHVDRALKVTPPGQAREGVLKVQYTRLTMQAAADLVVSHDLANAANDSEGNRKESGKTYTDRDAWLYDCMQQHLLGWSLEDGDTGVPYDITAEVLTQFLSIDAFYWATYNDWLDYITKVANGKSKTENETEIKNLLNSGRTSSNNRGGLR